MGNNAITWAAATKPASPLDKLLLYILATYADDEGRCCPSQAMLATDSQLSERAVRKHLASLEAQGLLRREERRTKCGGRTSDLISLELDGGAHDGNEVAAA